MTSRRSLLAATAGAFLVFCAIGWRVNQPQIRPDLVFFSWEYGSIAEALVTGRGYSDPFSLGSGPTAWMPPLLVFVTAGVFGVLGVKTMPALVALMAIKFAGLAAGFGLLLRVLRGSSFPSAWPLLLITFAGYLTWHRDAAFGQLHDVWLTFLGLCAVVASLQWVREAEDASSFPTGPAILAFLLPLGHPILAGSFGVLWLLEARRRVREAPGDSPSARASAWLRSPSARRWLAVAACGALSTGVWTVRNYAAFADFVPVKSNLWFDFHQANCDDGDGIVSSSNFMRGHPIHPNRARLEFEKLGEQRFVDRLRAPCVQQLGDDLPGYLARVVNRLRNALVYTQPQRDFAYLREPIDRGDAQRLAIDGLMFVDERNGLQAWVSFEISPEDFGQRVASLDLRDAPSSLASWTEQRARYLERVARPAPVARALGMSLIPTLAALLGLSLRRVRSDPTFRIALGVYVLYLVPYALLSHYERYQIPLMGIQSLLITLALAPAYQHLRGGRQSRAS